MFPSGFLWGVASAAYQVEGAGGPAHRGDSVWDHFARTSGRVRDPQLAPEGIRQVERLEEDVALIAGLGVGAYRCSISWPRVLPEGRGRVNVEGLAYYDRLVDALLAAGVAPWITLFHWDLPLVLHRRGGWTNREVADWFADYTAVVVDRLSDRVQHWMTLNEPQVFLGHGYADGIHAPGYTWPRADVLLATHHVLMAHGRAVQVIRARSQRPPTIGWAPVGVSQYPATDTAADIEAARRATFTVKGGPGWASSNTWYSDPVVLGEYPEDGLRVFGKDVPRFKPEDMSIIRQPLDFYGINVYQGRPVRATPDGGWEEVPLGPGYPHTYFQWPVTPEVLYWTPKFLYERYQLPLYVTENGLASMDWVHRDGTVPDPGRIDFLSRYLEQLARSTKDGADVRGYFHWSIFDNLEWAEGTRMRFGLVHVDYTTFERTPKQSYAWYRNVVRTNGASINA